MKSLLRTIGAMSTLAIGASSSTYLLLQKQQSGTWIQPSRSDDVNTHADHVVTNQKQQSGTWMKSSRSADAVTPHADPVTTNQDRFVFSSSILSAALDKLRPTTVSCQPVWESKPDIRTDFKYRHRQVVGRTLKNFEAMAPLQVTKYVIEKVLMGSKPAEYPSIILLFEEKDKQDGFEGYMKECQLHLLNEEDFEEEESKCPCSPKASSSNVQPEPQQETKNQEDTEVPRMFKKAVRMATSSSTGDEGDEHVGQIVTGGVWKHKFSKNINELPHGTVLKDFGSPEGVGVKAKTDSEESHKRSLSPTNELEEQETKKQKADAGASFPTTFSRFVTCDALLLKFDPTVDPDHYQEFYLYKVSALVEGKRDEKVHHDGTAFIYTTKLLGFVDGDFEKYNPLAKAYGTCMLILAKKMKKKNPVTRRMEQVLNLNDDDK